MKKILDFWLMVALVCGLSMSVTSCKDDDKNDNQNGGQSDNTADKDMADAALFWSVVGQLTDTPMPDDWQNATYEPSIGEPDGTNSAVRIVNCADEESAAASASDLLGTSITTATQSYTYENDLVGKLTYRKTGGSSLATVDVSIQQMPGLSQIVYKTPEQIGENASFKGTAYYRFGDVVKKLNKDGEYDYWICVRPCLSFVSKTDSHWMTLSKLPSDYVKSQEKTVNGNKFKHQMPKNLANNSDHMQNMAEMVYAMTCPTDWAYNLGTNKGYQKLKYFKDLNYEKHFKYNNEWFFTKVANGWEAHDGDLFQTIFGLSREDLKAHVQAKGFAMVYGNATMSGNDITLTVYKYNGTNLKTKSSVKSTGKWDYAPFDINQLMSKHYIVNDMVVPAEDGRYWVARYATGETLAKGADATKFDTYKKMPNCEDVFVYNRDVEHFDMTEETLKATEPKVAGEHGNEKGYYQLGDVIKYNNRYYVCASNHDIDETARFVTFNDNASHETKTFEWKGLYTKSGQSLSDTVYSDKMASAETLKDWIVNILCDDDKWSDLLDRMNGLDRNRALDVVPQTDDARHHLLACLLSGTLMLDISKTYGAARSIEQFEWMPLRKASENLKENPEDSVEIMLFAPVTFVLADQMRYSTHLSGPTDHWVPYITLISSDSFNQGGVKAVLDQEESQTTLSPSHFQWKDFGEYRFKGNSDYVERKTNKPFHVVELSMYWYHHLYNDNYEHYWWIPETWNAMVLNFTKNYLYNPKTISREQAEQHPERWTNQCITSREITFTDNGKQQSKYTVVSLAGRQ